MRSLFIGFLAGLALTAAGVVVNPYRAAEQALDAGGYIQLGRLRPVAFGCAGMRTGFTFAAISAGGGVTGGKVCVGGFRAAAVAEVGR